MEIRLLGPVELWAAGREIPLGTPRQRCVLAVLAVAAGQPVGVDPLLARVWGERLPGDVRNVLYTHVSRLRRVLESAGAGTGKDVLRRAGAGYVLDVDPDRVDLHRFRGLEAAARAPGGGGDERVVRLLDEAVGLWRGVPLAGLTGDWVERTREGIGRERFAVLTAVFAARLRLGGHARVIGPLSDLVADHPSDEALASLLMLALYRCGRPADALRVYADVRQRLVDEIGDEPGVRLRRLHERILRRDPALDEHADAGPGAPAPASPRYAPVPPAQLPADVAGFAGRTDALKALDELLPPADLAAAPAAISAIVGAAGLGKTALAVHWAHRVAHRFPDGQLYVNLHGFDPTLPPTDPAVALRGFLDAFAVPPQRIPTTPEGQAALYRSLLSGRRVLVVLDNARDAEQVRPLLPGAPGCLAVVTSRDRLTGLIAAQGARPVVLDLLPRAEAERMLERRIGADRLAAEPQAAGEIITRCARLPLALAIAAAQAAIRPQVPLVSLAAGLRDSHAGLDAFTGPDMATDMRAVFSWSYRTLSEPAARMFRLLGLHPGPDIAVPAAAGLAAVTPVRARALLAELAEAHLVVEHGAERYSVHDLLRAYATELVSAADTSDDRSTSICRVLDHYLHTAYAAMRLLQPNRDPITPRPAVPEATPERLADEARARVWFAAEYSVLLATVRHATANGFDTHAWQLAWTLVGFCEQQGLWSEQVNIARVALNAAVRSADRLGQAHAHCDLGGAYTRLSLPDDAYSHLRHALDLFGAVGDLAGQARTHLRLGWTCFRPGHHEDAISHDRDALDLYRATGDLVGQGRALNNIGWMHALLGRHQQAITYCRQALTLHHKAGDRPGQANTWDSLGFAYHRLGQHAEAIACYQRAVGLYRQTGDRYLEADTLIHLGDTHLAAGDVDPDSAHHAWRQALTILDELNHPDADQIRAKLERPGSNVPMRSI